MIGEEPVPKGAGAVAESSSVPAKPAKRRGTAGGNREEKRNGQQREYIIFGRPVLQ